MTYQFTTVLLTSTIKWSYCQSFDTKNVNITYRLLCAGGSRIVTKVRKLPMFQYGGTVGPARYPMFSTKDNLKKLHMLPRPVVKSRPGQIGWKIMKTCTWLNDLCKDIEMLVIESLTAQKTQKSESILKHINYSKAMLPPCLRICNTFFTQMIMVGSSHTINGDIPLHLDKDDHITALLSLGSSHIEDGGETLYIETSIDVGLLNITKCIPFKNGNLQFGTYDKVLHGARRWSNEMRGVINFSLQKKLLHHFYTYGSEPYQHYMDANYPSGSFHAIV